MKKQAVRVIIILVVVGVLVAAWTTSNYDLGAGADAIKYGKSSWIHFEHKYVPGISNQLVNYITTFLLIGVFAGIGYCVFKKK